MKLKLKFQLGSEGPFEQPNLFCGLPPVRRPALEAMLLSVLGHVVFVSGATVGVYFLQLYGEQPLDLSQYHVETMRLRLSEPIFLSNPQKERPKLQAPPRPKPAPKPVETASAPPVQPSPPEPRAASVTRRFELPPPRERAKDAPIILQPDFIPQAPPPKALPPMTFWSAKVLEGPKPPPKSEVIPGRTSAAASVPKLAAPPVLEVPNRELNAGTMNISLPPAPVAAPPPALPVPNSTTMPVRQRDATESQAASFEVTAGQGVNVMTLATEHRDLTRVEIPKGLQNIPQSGPPVDAPGPAAAKPEPPKPPAPAPGPQAAPKKNVTASAAPAKAAPKENGGTPSSTAGAKSGTNGNPAGSSPQPAGTSTGPASSQQQQSPQPPPAPSNNNNSASRTNGTPPGVTRIDHPVNGNFDVVMMQSAVRDDLPDLGGMLTGTPVYTVYLRVGDKKEWLLEYCIPGKPAAPVNPYQLDIDDVGSISPPYPITTEIPTAIQNADISRHVVFKAMLTANGVLQSVKAPDGNDGIFRELAALMSQWQFRPAQRNKKAVEVEVLLVIPPR